MITARLSPLAKASPLLTVPVKEIAFASTLREAWGDPVVYELIERSILNGNFKNSTWLGEAFLQRIENLCETSLNDEGIYKKLRTFFELLEKRENLHSGFSAERTERVQRRIKQIKELLGNYKPKSLLDVGCGSGDITNSVRESLKLPSQKVLGLEVLARENPDIPFEILEFDGLDLPLGDKSFDLVNLFTVLHHAEDPQKLLREIYRVLEPGGSLVVREFDAPTRELKLFNLVMDEMLYKVYTPLPDVPIPGNYLGYEEWAEMFQDAGFKIERTMFPEPDNPYKPFMTLLVKN